MKKTPSKKHYGNVSLSRALSKLGFCSRSQAVKLIEGEKIFVNGSIVNDPMKWVDLLKDKIAVEGKRVPKKQFIYIVMNKPKGVVTTRADERSRQTVYDLLAGMSEWIFPVGRLDKDSSGLLFLTNDNQFGERLTNPSSKIPKTYRAKLDKELLKKHQHIIQQGMIMDDEQLLPAKVKILPGTNDENWIELTIVEGKNRQVRRMCKELGYEVSELTRIAIGKYSMGNMAPAEWKYLKYEDIKSLF